MEVEKDAPSSPLDCASVAAAAAAAGGGDNDADDADSCDAVCMQAINASSSTVSLFATSSPHVHHKLMMRFYDANFVVRCR